jgi:AcrR family transcriptional regulator
MREIEVAPMRPDRRKTVAHNHPAAADRETKGQILQAAEGLFIERGFKGVAMRDVADAVQVTQAALYYYFPGGKRELFVETIRKFLREMAERAFQGLESAPSFRARLTLLTRNVLTVPIDRWAPLLHDAHEYLHEAKPDLMGEINNTFVRRATDLFQEAIDAGEISAGIPAALLVTFHVGMCTALLNRRHFGGEEPTPGGPGDEQRVAQALVAVFLDGVGRAPPAAAAP